MSIKRHGRSTFFGILQRYVGEYLKQTGKDRATTKELAVWAIATDRWHAPDDLMVRKCREDFARAMREEYFADEEGHPIRAKHVARERQEDRQVFFWADIRTASRKHMLNAFRQRRMQIVGECRQLKRDADYYNRHSDEGRPIQMLFDFRDDLEEADLPTVYPARRPDEASASAQPS